MKLPPVGKATKRFEFGFAAACLDHLLIISSESVFFELTRDYWLMWWCLCQFQAISAIPAILLK
jgi:hypothetical protein